MEKQLSYVIKLSLKQMALRKVAVILWKAGEVLDSISEFEFKKSCGWDFGTFLKWRNHLELRVMSRISMLDIPESLKVEIKPITQAVGIEILKWSLLHGANVSNEDGYISVHVLEKLCWTTAGSVDYKKTAEQIVCSNVVDIGARFYLACLYCLETFIPELWTELPEENQKTFCESKVDIPHLQLFLPHVFEKQFELCDLPPITFQGNYFSAFSFCGNKTLVEYYFKKLTKKEKEVNLVQTTRDVIIFRDKRDYSFRFRSKTFALSDVVCYLLSLLTPDEQIGIFKELPCQVLKCFMVWPWRDLFLDVADIILPFLPESKYTDLYLTMYGGITRERSYDYFPNLFQKFFVRSPIGFKKYFVNKECRSSLNYLDVFLHQSYAQTITVIFRNVDTIDRVRLVSSECGLKRIFEIEYPWPMVELCLREATLSKEDKVRLIESVVERKGKEEQSEWLTQRYQQFLKFMNETEVSAPSKRRLEDDTLIDVKRNKILLCN